MTCSAGPVLAVVVTLCVAAPPLDAVAAGGDRGRASAALRALRRRRAQLAHRGFGIIGNNDGCDVLYFPANVPVTPETFLAQRTTALAGTEVGAIAYCTISSGFSFFTHNTRVGTLLTRQPADYGLMKGRRNIARDLIEQGADCLQLVVRFAHDHGMAAFWSMRMNDTHDVAYSPDHPYLLYPPLKEQHPDWLVGKVARHTRYGRWSSVNYALPEVRDLAFRFIEEVCTGYDVDGVELDFFRHLCYFPSTANGKTASDAERNAMTDLLRRVRRMTEEVGLRRKRPILISIRVPDSVEYCRDLGLDVGEWLKEGLVDILVTTGYFRLNPWSYSVELGHRYGVAVYPCLSDSRVRGEVRFRRASIEGYRGRAINAWLAGADGVHLFNYFNPRSGLWKELGSPATLAGRDKLFFVTVRDGSPDAWLAGGSRYRRVPILTPTRPLPLAAGRPVDVQITVGEDFDAGRGLGRTPEATLHVRLAGRVPPERVRAAWNGRPLPQGTPAGDVWLDFPLDPATIRRGPNRVTLNLARDASVREARDTKDYWNIVYEAGRLPAPPWQVDRPATRTVARIQDGALLIADRGKNSGDYRYYRRPWGLAPDDTEEVVIEARVKVISGLNSIIFGNGETGQRLCLYPDRIQLYHNPGSRFRMDTTDGFHTYRIAIRGTDVRIWVDGVLRIHDEKGFGGRRPVYRCELGFGAANSTDLGEALWKFVRAHVPSTACQDIVVRVTWRDAGRKQAR